LIAVNPTMTAVSDQEFSLYQKLIYAESGIFLIPAKKALLVARLGGRLRELGMESFRAYYHYVIADSTRAELVCLLDRIVTNETRFFREARQFEFIEQQLLPAWLSPAGMEPPPRRLRVWSAGCSTGEEPYSLAMAILHHLPPTLGVHVEIVGSDLSSRAIAAAQKALWPIAQAQEIPKHYLKRFMLKGIGAQAAYMKAGPELRAAVSFQRINLNDASHPIDGLFDWIFCRNVLIYFNSAARARVVGHLLDHLAPGGHLFVGHAESLSGLNDRLGRVIPTVYRHAPAQAFTRIDSPSMLEESGAAE
jgi:chemotaxis protein methyltransferase CheR